MKAQTFQTFVNGGDWTRGALDGKQAVRVIIAYEDVSAAKRAMRVLADLDQGLGEAIEFVPLPWPFDLLAEADWREAALNDALGSEILMVTTSGPGPIPRAVEQWVEAAAASKQGTAAAIVALLGSAENLDSTGSLRLAAIRTAARRAGLGFFAPAARRELNEVARRIHQRAETVTPLLHDILFPRHPPPAWGINE